MFKVPQQPAELHFANSRWPRVARVLFWLATSESSVRFELGLKLAEEFLIQPKSAMITRIFNKLATEGLIHMLNCKVVKTRKIVLVRLSDKGKALCSELGWDVVPNEWEKLLLYHSGSSQPKHTAAVIAFAYSARLRGWQTEVLPPVTNPNFFPDVRVQKGDQSVYVEVELGKKKPNKWRLVKREQGYVAICAKTTAGCYRLIRECLGVNAGGIGTDLLSLHDARHDNTTPLWLYKWEHDDDPAKWSGDILLTGGKNGLESV